MKCFSAILAIVASVCVSAAPLAVRQAFVGQEGADVAAGPSAVNDVTVNSGSLTSGSLDSDTSFEGASFDGFVGNTFNDFNSNLDLHDNIISNANLNKASNTDGPTVVGNGNSILDASAFGYYYPEIPVFPVYPQVPINAKFPFFKRDYAPVDTISSFSDPMASNNVDVNSGAMQEGSIDSGLTFDGAEFQNAAGNSFTDLNSATDISGNNLQDPNWNTISDNNGPAVSGNNNNVQNFDNSGMIVNLDADFLAQQYAQQQQLIRSFLGHRFF